MAPLWEWPAIQACVETESFSEFIRHPRFWDDLASQPQVAWILDEEGDEMVDFVGRVENIDADLDKVVSQIGLPRRAIGRTNGSAARRGPQHFPTEDDYGLLKDAYAADFERFGYDPEMRIPVAG